MTLKNFNRNAGFSTVEMLVSILVGAILLIIAYQLFVMSIQVRQNVAVKEVFAQRAEMRIRDYESQVRPDKSWFTCDSTSDLVSNNSAAGQAVGSTITETYNTYTATGQLRAFAPRGCGAGLPIQMTLTLTYAISGTNYTVTRSGYVNVQ